MSEYNNHKRKNIDSMTHYTRLRARTRAQTIFDLDYLVLSILLLGISAKIFSLVVKLSAFLSVSFSGNLNKFDWPFQLYRTDCTCAYAVANAFSATKTS